MKLFMKAVLVIHGFSGQLVDNEVLVNKLQFNKRFDCFAWTLPAHDKNKINKVKYQEWIKAVERQVELLIKKGYKKIYIVGHSMGGVLSGYLVTKYKEIKKVVFVSAAYNYLSGNQYLKDMKSILTVIKDEDVSYRNVFSKLQRVPVSTAFEFRKLVKELKPSLSEIKTPCLILQSELDEVVPYETMDYIYNNIGSINKSKTTILSARHNVLKGKRKKDVAEYIERFLIGGKKWKQVKRLEI